MTDQKIYADNFRCTFDDPGDFIQFLKERKENSRWMTAPSRNLVFESLEKNTQMGELYLKLYDHDGRAEIIADTMENTSLLLKVNGETYPVRSCAIKSILERARISGHALNKVSKSIFTQILNYCMDVASGDSLIKVADDKVSAVHGGDPKDYAILEILPLVQCVRSILDRDFAGNHFLTANFDHSIVTAIWSLDGQANELMETYRQAVAEKGVTEAMSARPGLRFTTSDVGVSAANLYPILLLGGSNRIIPLGDPLKLDHKNGADLDAFASSMDQLYACFKESIERQQQLLDVEIRYPYTTMLGVLKRIMTETVTKKIPTINAVEGFDPAEFTRQLPNEDGSTSLYLDVKYRLLWFRLHRPQGKIVPDIVHVDEKSAVVSCKLYEDKADAADQFLAQASAQRFCSEEKYGDRYLEIAETAAIGRVLAAAGYGTQFCGNTDMLSGIIADAPIEMMDAEEDVPASQISSSTMPQPAPASVTPSPKPIPTTQPPQQTTPMSLDDYLNTMTLEDAKAVKVDCGYNAGKTLGEVAMRKPSDLDWYVQKYNGRNLALKAAAILLVNAAAQRAS